MIVRFLLFLWFKKMKFWYPCSVIGYVNHANEPPWTTRYDGHVNGTVPFDHCRAPGHFVTPLNNSFNDQ